MPSTRSRRKLNGGQQSVFVLPRSVVTDSIAAEGLVELAGGACGEPLVSRERSVMFDRVVAVTEKRGLNNA